MKILTILIISINLFSQDVIEKNYVCLPEKESNIFTFADLYLGVDAALKNFTKKEILCSEGQITQNMKTCFKDISCVLGSSNPIGKAVYSLSKSEGQCVNKSNDCATRFVNNIGKSVEGIFKGIWGLIKIGAKTSLPYVTYKHHDKIIKGTKLATDKMAEKLSNFFKSESKVSFIKDYINKKYKQVKSLDPQKIYMQQEVMKAMIFMNVWNGLKAWMSYGPYCRKWEGKPHFSTCLEGAPLGCLSCSDVIKGHCSIQGALIPEVVLTLLGANLIVKPVKWTGTLASKVFGNSKILSQASQTMSKASTPISRKIAKIKFKTKPKHFKNSNIKLSKSQKARRQYIQDKIEKPTTQEIEAKINDLYKNFEKLNIDTKKTKFIEKGSEELYYYADFYNDVLKMIQKHPKKDQIITSGRFKQLMTPPFKNIDQLRNNVFNMVFDLEHYFQVDDFIRVFDSHIEVPPTFAKDAPIGVNSLHQIYLNKSKNISYDKLRNIINRSEEFNLNKNVTAVEKHNSFYMKKAIEENSTLTKSQKDELVSLHIQRLTESKNLKFDDVFQAIFRYAESSKQSPIRFIEQNISKIKTKELHQSASSLFQGLKPKGSSPDLGLNTMLDDTKNIDFENILSLSQKLLTDKKLLKYTNTPIKKGSSSTPASMHEKILNTLRDYAYTKNRYLKQTPLSDSPPQIQNVTDEKISTAITNILNHYKSNPSILKDVKSTDLEKFNELNKFLNVSQKEKSKVYELIKTTFQIKSNGTY